MNLVLRYLSQFAYFRNHRASGRRAYFRLAGQLSQVCAESVHIFAYYPRMLLALLVLSKGAPGNSSYRVCACCECLLCAKCALQSVKNIPLLGCWASKASTCGCATVYHSAVPNLTHNLAADAGCRRLRFV